MQVTMPNPQWWTCWCRCHASSSWSTLLNYKLKTKHISRTLTRQWLKNKILDVWLWLLLFVSEVDNASAYLAWLSYITFSNCQLHSRSFASWMCGPYLLRKLQGSKELLASICLSASWTSHLVILEVSYPSATVLSVLRCVSVPPCYPEVWIYVLLLSGPWGYMLCFGFVVQRDWSTRSSTTSALVGPPLWIWHSHLYDPWGHETHVVSNTQLVIFRVYCVGIIWWYCIA